jgi:acetylornithine deacetylase/succinyl-diaminopimelate desuccinylase-like protein
MKAVKAVKAAIAAIEEIRYWSFQENDSLASIDIGVYVDDAEQVGEELIRYDGVIEGAVEGSMGYPSKGWDAWNKILDKHFGEFEWEHPAHFAVSVYDIDSVDGGEAQELADQFNDELKGKYEPVFYSYGHLDVVYMAQKQSDDDAFAIKYKDDKIAQALIAAQQ